MARLRNHDQNHEGESDQKGWVVDLPNDVWASILSRLEMKEAAKMSILSRRWRYVWTYNPHLNFDASSSLADLKQGRSSRSEERSKYMKWVYQVLGVHRASTIDKFRVAFPFNQSHAPDIDKWITFALRKEVKELELVFSALSGSYNCYYLTLNLFRDLPSDACLSSLTSLSLTNVNVNRELLEFLLSKCVRLERLSVIGSTNLSGLRVAGSSLKLKYLDIRGSLGMEKLEIFAPQLLSLTYFGPSSGVAFSYVPSLVEASLGSSFGWHLLTSGSHHFLGFASQLEKLSLDLGQMRGRPARCPIFRDLKQLQLSCVPQFGLSFVYVPPILKACLYLQKLTLQFTTWSVEEGRGEQLEDAKFPHLSLKEVEVLGFTGQLVELDLLLFLVKMAIELEKIVLDCRPPPLIGTPHEWSPPDRLQAARKCAREVVEQARSNVKVVIR